MTTLVKKYKLCRRLGAGIFEKCQTQKFLAAATVGNKGSSKKAPARRSDYGLQLIEKQKVRFLYGIREKQFRNYVDYAMDHIVKGTSPAKTLGSLLERRLDNAVYRLGLATTRAQARQAVSHGHITVNGIKMTIPSYQLQIGDVITIRPGSLGTTFFKDINVKLANVKPPSWINRDEKNLISAKISSIPDTVDPMLNLQVVIEFYSR